MGDSNYRGIATRGGMWGLAAAILVGAPLFGFLLIGATLGDCVPSDPCDKAFWQPVMLPTLAVAVPVYLLVRWIVNRFGATR